MLHHNVSGRAEPGIPYSIYVCVVRGAVASHTSSMFQDPQSEPRKLPIRITHDHASAVSSLSAHFLPNHPEQRACNNMGNAPRFAKSGHKNLITGQQSDLAKYERIHNKQRSERSYLSDITVEI